MKHIRPVITATSIFVLTMTARAEVTEQEAIQSQLASALASADYAAKNCRNLVINQSRIEELTKRSGKSLTELKSSEEYAEQRDVILGLEKSNQGHLICSVLSMAHGGYARGVISER